MIIGSPKYTISALHDRNSVVLGSKQLGITDDASVDDGDPKINLHINEENLGMIGSNKYLGVQIDSELK